MESNKKLVDSLLKQINYRGGLVPVNNIAKKLDIHTFKEKMIDNEFAKLYIGGNTKEIYNVDKVIVINDKLSYEKQRIALAYMLGYYLLDYNNCYEFYKSLYSITEYSEVCYKFTMEILLPYNIFYRQYVKSIVNSDFNILYMVKYLANYFKVNETLIKQRIKEIE